MKPARALWLLTYLLFSAALAHGKEKAIFSSKPVSPVSATPADKAASPEKVTLPDKEATLKADSLFVDSPTDSYRAEGNVQILQGGGSLLADSVIYRRLTGDTLAEGDVLLERGGDTMKGDRLSLNLLTQNGELTNGELFIKKSNFRLRAPRLLKTGEDDYRVEQGTFTTCDGEHPSWRFEAKKVDVTLNEYATARNAVFYVDDFPIFYTPYLVFPANTDRQSGLMIPKLGFSSKKGFYLDQPYYWAIDPSQEATFDLDLESSRGVGAGVDYRYLRPNDSQGRLRAFGIYDTNESKFRGELQQKHLELLTPELTLASTVHLVSDRRYYLDYGEFSGEYNRQLLESSVSFDRRWERYGLSGALRYDQDLEAANNRATLQRLPTFGFIAAGEKVGPLFLSMDSSLTNFEHAVGPTGQRLVLHPRVSYYAKPAGILDFSLFGAFQQRLYNAGGDTPETGWRQIGQADGGGSLSLPLERIYDGTLRHLLVPSLQYNYVQRRSDEDLPFYDYGDRVLGQSIAYWSVANTFTRKYAREGMPDEYRDILYLKLSQGYQFSGQRRDLLTLVDEGNRLTDLMLESVVSPLQELSLLVDGRYNTTDNQLSTANLGVQFKGEGRNQATVTYRHSRDQLDYLGAGVTFPLTSQLTADLLGRYSFDKGGFLESRYAVEYRQQCWSVVLAYSDRVSSHQVSGEKQFTINFSLAGLGSLGPLQTF
ncbi:LPS assembly protein LptD [Geomonas sp. Red69]|uniref:LPS-assembly protein LptD n=1 Tax=Geomonas diazotrophica TaxID=2843197 RepID=UPI001C104F46|nr:LPS assembly protein LptD [Geomonas diazotrophica]MBU5638649.1 LPS assembly protein LptD [Geomonas diazotrophica]